MCKREQSCQSHIASEVRIKSSSPDSHFTFLVPIIPRCPHFISYRRFNESPKRIIACRSSPWCQILNRYSSYHLKCIWVTLQFVLETSLLTRKFHEDFSIPNSPCSISFISNWGCLQICHCAHVPFFGKSLSASFSYWGTLLSHFFSFPSRLPIASPLLPAPDRLMTQSTTWHLQTGLLSPC